MKQLEDDGRYLGAYMTKLQDEISRELDVMLAERSEPGFERILEDVEAKLRALYREKFPKQCGNCGRVYETREQYLHATRDLRRENCVFVEEVNKVMEFRNCVCGSTLTIVSGSRRDETDFGVARRRFFNTCVEKIVAATEQSRSSVEEQVREVFRNTIHDMVSPH